MFFFSFFFSAIESIFSCGDDETFLKVPAVKEENILVLDI